MLESRAKAIHPYKGIRRYGVNYLGLAPFFTLMLVFIAAPMVYGIVTSFSNWSMSSAKTGIEFVGLKIMSSFFRAWDLFHPLLKSLQSGLLYSLYHRRGPDHFHGFGADRQQHHGQALQGVQRPVLCSHGIAPVFVRPDLEMVLLRRYHDRQFLASLGIGPGECRPIRPATPSLVVLIDIWNSVGFNFIIFSTGMQDVPRSCMRQLKLTAPPPIRECIYHCL